MTFKRSIPEGRLYVHGYGHEEEIELTYRGQKGKGSSSSGPFVTWLNDDPRVDEAYEKLRQDFCELMKLQHPTAKVKGKLTFKAWIVSSLASLLVFIAGCNTNFNAPHGTLEMMAGQTTTFDGKVNVSSKEGRGVFARTRINMDETGKTTPFSLVDLYQKVYGGVDAVFETQAISGEDLVPRAGIQYFKQTGDLQLYGLITAKTDKETDYELVTCINYQPKINESTRLFSQLETFTNFDDNGHNCTAIRPRIGLKLKDNLRFGVAPEVSIDSEGNYTNNIGLFLGWDF